MSTTHLRATAGVVIGLVLTVVAAACGVRVDEEPRALDLPTTTTEAPTPSTGPFSTVLYFVVEGELVPAVGDLPNRGVESVLVALRDPAAGLGTSIPSGTEVLGVVRDGDNIQIDLSESFDNMVGVSRQQAIGQIVLTVTEMSNIETVQFSVAGRPITLGSPIRGDISQIGPCDFIPLLASVQDATQHARRVPTIAVGKLIDRVAELEQTCRTPGERGVVGG